MKYIYLIVQLLIVSQAGKVANILELQTRTWFLQ